jgi:cellobiose phosphorylase
MEAQARVGEWNYKAEPYVYSSNIMGPESLNFGLANVSWLSGTAAWMYIAVTQYIMGVKADFDGLTITPCLPDEWRQVNVKRNFRDCTYNIEIKPSENGKTYFEEDGKIFETHKIPHIENKQQRDIIFYYVK